jgi:hypothetical protein
VLLNVTFQQAVFGLTDIQGPFIGRSAEAKPFPCRSIAVDGVQTRAVSSARSGLGQS